MVTLWVQIWCRWTAGLVHVHVHVKIDLDTLGFVHSCKDCTAQKPGREMSNE